LFFFWDFRFYPLLNIILKGFIITVLYILVIYKLRISDEINAILKKLLKKIMKW
jgi:hypothetical protein